MSRSFSTFATADRFADAEVLAARSSFCQAHFYLKRRVQRWLFVLCFSVIFLQNIIGPCRPSLAFSWHLYGNAGFAFLFLHGCLTFDFYCQKCPQRVPWGQRQGTFSAPSRGRFSLSHSRQRWACTCDFARQQQPPYWSALICDLSILAISKRWHFLDYSGMPQKSTLKKWLWERVWEVAPQPQTSCLFCFVLTWLEAVEWQLSWFWSLESSIR